MDSNSRPSERRRQIKEKIEDCDRQTTFWTLIKIDMAEYYGWKRALTIPGFWVVFGYRIARWLHKKKLDLFAKVFQIIVALLTGCNISRKAIIGAGLCIYHPKDIFVGAHVLMGEDCNLGPHVFISSNLRPFDLDDYPIIDGGLRISFGGVILGGITLGKKVRVGPNAVVVKDVPDNYNVIPSPSRAVPRDGWKKSVQKSS